MQRQTCTAISAAFSIVCGGTNKNGRAENPSELTGPLHPNIKLLLVAWTLLSTRCHLKYNMQLEILPRAICPQQTHKF